MDEQISSNTSRSPSPCCCIAVCKALLKLIKHTVHVGFSERTGDGKESAFRETLLVWNGD